MKPVVIQRLAMHTIELEPRRAGASRQSQRRAHGYVVVEGQTAEGRSLEGVGEAAPCPWRGSPAEGMAESCEALQAMLPVPVARPMDAYVLAASCARSPAVQFALETALVDAWCAAAEVPLRYAYGSAAACEVGANHVAATLAEIDEALALGATSLKVKLRGSRVEDLALLEHARRAGGAALRLHADANQAWRLDEAPQALAALAHVELAYIEEPCRDTLALLAQHPRLAVPVALDETLAWQAPSAWGAALGHASLWGLVIKPSVVGGLFASWLLLEVARRHSKHAVLTHGLESPVGMAACQELALAALGHGLVAGPQGLSASAVMSPETGQWRGALRTAAGEARLAGGGAGPAWWQTLGLSAWPADVLGHGMTRWLRLDGHGN